MIVTIRKYKTNLCACRITCADFEIDLTKGVHRKRTRSSRNEVRRESFPNVNIMITLLYVFLGSCALQFALQYLM